MSAAAARPVLRSSALRFAARRYQSTTTQKATEAAKESATKAQETAQETTSKASQGLSRVTSAAGGAAKGLTSALGKIGGRTGRLFAFVERQTPFVVYYSKVGLEMAKYVAHGQKMSPPSIATFQTYYQNLFQSLRSGSLGGQSAQGLLQRARNIGPAQIVAGGVVAAECLGFFTVGEMIGRFKLVGYHGETGAHH
ncbi:ATP synthase subunit g-like protein [Emericellopsis cladophorae]|uniref:ATP synthase subunit g-like protein n=1 Tax=Emericellopsis cladophorae TaxID=2686198 RepID=A0A9P9Y4J4_9HYPO|nr:ATP synthase subunit g-like protein [Emericellopsis cladophorae]KAI6783286.1 ATP synthase subunit g-like protein [Emericellopsis cladophorae]